MRKQFSITIIFALLVVSAGCLGILTGPTADNVDYPDGYAQSGVTDPSDAASLHANETVDSGSFASTYQVEYQLENKQVNLSEKRTVNVDTETYVAHSTGASMDSDQYASEGTAHIRVNRQDGSSPVYRKQSATFDETSLTYESSMARFLGNVNYSEVSVSEENGNTLITYTGSDVNESGPLASQSEVNNVEDLHSKLVVDTEGRVHLFTLSATVTTSDSSTASISFTLSFSEHGSATVQKPDWLDEAKQNTDG